MAAHNDVSTATVALWGVLGVLLLLVILFGLEVVFHRVDRSLAVERDAVAPAVAVSEAQANQRSELAATRLIDKAKGVYQIPVDRAMELIVAEHAQPAGRGKP